MPASIVVGLQWGDEGKGKIIDLLTAKSQLVVRSQGGNNAGHTIVRDGHEYRFHLVPSGILYPHAFCCIAGGTVIDPAVLWKEIEQLKSAGITVKGRLLISPYAHVIFPFHRELDRLAEERKGKSAIGTTGRGIGPCYVDKAARIGVRIADLLEADALRKNLQLLVESKNLELERLYGKPPIDFTVLYEEYLEWGRKLKDFVGPVEKRIQEALREGKQVLFEGAHGALLDGTYGTYPFVTSSSTLTAGVLSGAACFSEGKIHAIGVSKAYSTRVGSGPFPTELTSEQLHLFPSHEQMREIGTTTGRKRRIGWLDLFLLRHMIEMSGIHEIALMKIDILDSVSRGKICTGYRSKGKLLDEPPVTSTAWDSVEPMYEEFEGWNMATTRCKDISELPKQARRYLEKIETFCGVKITWLSLGPDHNQTLHLQRPILAATR